jgi:hypothetical protein
MEEFDDRKQSVSSSCSYRLHEVLRSIQIHTRARFEGFHVKEIEICEKCLVFCFFIQI